MSAQQVTPLVMATTPETAVVDVTPALAEKWLGKNTINRSVRRPDVAAYARDMAAGDWLLNGESIKFADDGALMDGQHRLLAVIESGVTVRMLVVSGVSRKAMPTIDTGIPRKFYDALAVQGIPHAKTVAALTTRAYAWEQGQRYNAHKMKPTQTERLDFLRHHPELHEAALLGDSLASRTLLPATVIGTAYWLFCKVAEPQEAEDFLRHVVREDVGVDHPARVLNRRIVAMRISVGRLLESEALALTIRAWNAHRDGRTALRLQMPRGGLDVGSFPTPK